VISLRGLVGAVTLAFQHASLAIIECWVASVAVTFVDAIGLETTVPQTTSHAVKHRRACWTTCFHLVYNAVFAPSAI
jgi:hypothetical protein